MAARCTLLSHEETLRREFERHLEELRLEAKAQAFTLTARIVELEKHATRLQAELERLQDLAA